MMNNKNRLSWIPLLIISCIVLMDSTADASWLSRRRRRKDLAQKQEDAATKQKFAAKKKSKVTDLKKMMDLSDTQVVSAESQAPQPPVPKTEQSIFDEDKYALPAELQHEAPKPKAPMTPAEPDEPLIEFNFEKASLTNLIQQIEAIFDVTFITDDAIKPEPKGSVKIEGNNITFKTNTPLTKQQAWDLFLTFLDVSGFAVVQQATPRMYRIRQIKDAYQSPLRTFIGSDLDDLPDSDEIIRFMYFIENSDLNTLKPIVDALKSPSAFAIGLAESRALLISDKSYNIKSLMQIVKELDKVSMPQAMSVLKLRQANAQDVADLYDALTKPAEQPQRMIGPRKPPTNLFFPENTKIIAEPRTNSLILLGQRDAIKKIEDFIIKNIDIDLEQPYSPLYIYKLKYADAETIAAILKQTTEIGEKTRRVGTSGGVRGGDKFLKPMTFTPEKETNQLIIKGNYEDYIMVKEIVDKLDIPQPQIAIEVLILELSLNDNKQLGTQLRSKESCAQNLLGKNIKFQTSGLFGTSSIVQNLAGPGVDRLLGNLINLVSNAVVGNTVLTLGQDIFGVWGVMALLEQITNVQIVSNPFLVTTNKTPATVKVGQTRRVLSANVTQGGTSQPVNTPQTALLEVTITPQINSDGMILLTIKVHIERFTATTEGSTANTDVKDVTTHAIVADKEVLALGGLIQNTLIDTLVKVPFLGDIPLLGWLFKVKSKAITKSNLLILVSPQIIRPEKAMEAQPYTRERINDYQRDMAETVDLRNDRDPVYRTFFAPAEKSTEETMKTFLFDRHKSKKETPSPVFAPAPQRPLDEIDVVATADTKSDDNPAYAQLKKKERSRSSLRNYMSSKSTEVVA